MIRNKILEIVRRREHQRLDEHNFFVFSSRNYFQNKINPTDKIHEILFFT